MTAVGVVLVNLALVVLVGVEVLFVRRYRGFADR